MYTRCRTIAHVRAELPKRKYAQPLVPISYCSTHSRLIFSPRHPSSQLQHLSWLQLCLHCRAAIRNDKLAQSYAPIAAQCLVVSPSEFQGQLDLAHPLTERLELNILSTRVLRSLVARAAESMPHFGQVQHWRRRAASRQKNGSLGRRCQLHATIPVALAAGMLVPADLGYIAGHGLLS